MRAALIPPGREPGLLRIELLAREASMPAPPVHGFRRRASIEIQMVPDGGANLLSQRGAPSAIERRLRTMSQLRRHSLELPKARRLIVPVGPDTGAQPPEPVEPDQTRRH